MKSLPDQRAIPGDVVASAGDEGKLFLDHVSAADKRKAWEDVLWALLNAKEFLFRH